MRRMRTWAPAAVFALALAACAAPPQVDAGEAWFPLVLEEYFTGRTQGDGAFVNSWTGSRRPFHVEIAGTWDGRVLTLVEDYSFADGEKDRKTWRLERTTASAFTGAREDLVGSARAWTEGNVVRLEYSLKLAGWEVDFADVLALRADGTVINRATVGKWGLRVGRIEIVLRKTAE